MAGCTGVRGLLVEEVVITVAVRRPVECIDHTLAAAPSVERRTLLALWVVADVAVLLPDATVPFGLVWV
jgi:hypothetical protein